jgi:tripartite-type tricarboxylate transporter receptor subunit TctC
VVPWIGLFAPAGTPRPIIDKLAGEVKRIVALPEVATNLESVGAVAAASTPEEFGVFLKEEHARWKAVIERLGLLGSN